jgi:hypothetical protein
MNLQPTVLHPTLKLLILHRVTHRRVTLHQAMKRAIPPQHIGQVPVLLLLLHVKLAQIVENLLNKSTMKRDHRQQLIQNHSK